MANVALLAFSYNNFLIRLVSRYRAPLVEAAAALVSVELVLPDLACLLCRIAMRTF